MPISRRTRNVAVGMAIGSSRAKGQAAAAQQQQAAMTAKAEEAAARAVANAQPQAAAAAPQDDMVIQIERLAALRDQGILTEEEFSAKKKQLLGI